MFEKEITTPAYSTEQVTRWHPDKYADQISDTLLTEYLKQDTESHCGIETMVKDATVIVAGEVSSRASVSVKDVVQSVADSLHYKVTDFINLISEQSTEINKAVTSVEEIGAGDQGMMYGYATIETTSMLPKPFELANQIIDVLSEDVIAKDYHVLLGDAKTQVTQSANGDIKAVISVCHSPYMDLDEVIRYVNSMMNDKLGLTSDQLIINPSGAWTIGGPTADCGLTGRKIVCDQYGGFTPVGGGAFSGKDPSKVDRSAAYMARKICCDLIKEFADEKTTWVQLQLAYAIGMAQPVSIHIDTDGSDATVREMMRVIDNRYDLTPRGIIQALGLYNKDYGKIAQGCHYRPDSGLFA